MKSKHPHTGRIQRIYVHSNVNAVNAEYEGLFTPLESIIQLDKVHLLRFLVI